jgi:hypothetical protein
MGHRRLLGATWSAELFLPGRHSNCQDIYATCEVMQERSTMVRFFRVRGERNQNRLSEQFNQVQ